MIRRLALLLCCAATAAHAADMPSTVRFATFNASLHGTRAGELVEQLADPAWPKGRAAAAILQEVRPDVVLINEFDWDARGEALARFRANFLAVGQDGRAPLDYPYAFQPETNTGEHSGHDLDRDGQVTSTPGSRAYGGDAFGYGEYPGQYGMVVLSRHPLDAAAIRTFRRLPWRDLPGARLPEGWYTPEALAVLRLSSKTHADVPVRIGGTTVHFLVSHPTPPSFDGPENRNGLRNRDEIRFWSLYLDGGEAPWLVDDAGRRGGLGGAPFVIAGDLNADPNDGDSLPGGIDALLAHPRVRSQPAPRSAGGAEQARLQGGANLAHRGDPAEDTADFGERGPGNLRVDYVLPSVELGLAASGVFWPTTDDPRFALVGAHPFPVSDHRLVWVDVVLPAGEGAP